MKLSIDLHGLSHDEALLKTENFIMQSSLMKNSEMEIITGRSSVLQQKIINELLAPHGFYYYIPPTNLGTIIISDTTL